MEGVPQRCELCETRIPPGRARCPGCGKVYGEENRCPACHGITAVREVDRGRYVCAACSAPRTRGPRTPLDSDFAQELSRKSLRNRVLSYVFFPVGGGLAAMGATILEMGQAWLEGAWSAFTSGIGGVMLATGAVGLYVATRAMRSAKELRGRATDQQLKLSVQRAEGGLTVADAAMEARVSAQDADARLTALAKAGEVHLDVDEAGTLRYRVVDPDADALEQVELEAEAMGLERER